MSTIRGLDRGEVRVERARAGGADVWIRVDDHRGDCAATYLSSAQARKVRDALDALLPRAPSPGGDPDPAPRAPGDEGDNNAGRRER
jgi:hypothetical protein